MHSKTSPLFHRALIWLVLGACPAPAAADMQPDATDPDPWRQTRDTADAWWERSRDVAEDLWQDTMQTTNDIWQRIRLHVVGFCNDM